MAFKDHWSFAAPIGSIKEAKIALEESKPDDVPQDIERRMDAAIKSALLMIGSGTLGEGPFSAAISGNGNKVYISLQEVSRNAVL